MKLPENNITVESSGQFTEIKSTIGNLSIVFDILRNKLYSNVIESITREISCNGRDANREVNKGDVPIEIHFPNAFDNNYKICDNGPGISPERVNNIYKAYGNSTKRDSNAFTGAFGLGSKTPLAYTNQFTIITTNQENNTTVTRTYIYYIDKSNEGIISLVSEQNLNLPTGTSIIIPVQDKDVQAFIDGTIKSTQYWPVRPLLFGISPPIEYPQTVGDLIAESKNWKIYNKKSINQYGNYSKPECLAIIDGIQYKINENFVDFEDRWILSCNVHLFFDIGTLTLSASREALQYDENTKKLINEQIKLVQKELSEQLIGMLDKKETYLEAVEFFNFMNLYFHKALNKQNLTWRGHKIIGSEIPVSLNILTNIKAKICNYTKGGRSKRNSVKLHQSVKFLIDKNSEIYYNDLDPEHTYRGRNIKALETHNHIQIINYIKGKTYDDFVTEYKKEAVNYFNSFNANKLNYYNEIDNSFILDIIKPKLLSSIIADKITLPPKAIKPKVTNVIKGYRLCSSSGWKLRNNFTPTNLDIDVEGCYVETVFKTDSFKTKYKNDYWHFSVKEVENIRSLLKNINIFSIKETDISKFTKLKPLSEVIEGHFNNIINEDYYKSMSMNKIISNYNAKHYNSFINLDELNNLLTLKNKIKDKSSIILKYFDYIKNIDIIVPQHFIEKLELLLDKKSNINDYVSEANILLSEMKSRYKLLSFIQRNAKDQAVVEYINACDQFNIHNHSKK